MRVIDRDLKLLACGLSGTFMPTYLVWDREVLEESYDQVDGISLHAMRQHRGLDRHNSGGTWR